VSVMLYRLMDSNYCGILVLDPHNEYFARLNRHPNAATGLITYSPKPERGSITLKINYQSLKPWHFSGIVSFTEAQNETIWTYYKEFKNDWLTEILAEDIPEKLQPRFERRALKEETLRVLQRKLELALRNSVFSQEGGTTTVEDIAQRMEEGKIVVIDTSGVSSETELLIGSILANDVFEKAKAKPGKLKSIVIEEAPRVLREGASNVFSSIAREGRKFGVGLIAITQLASLIPREVLANMNTKIILGNEMRAEREALIGSAAQDLSEDSKTIAGLDKGEAIITSVYTKFALPVQFPKFEDVAALDQQPPAKRAFA
ncbi:MAG: ATP-binding protein, partial [Candidatus Micrarchaeota archaeon]|nr:ATP-binding protein [Candidatus Micrarchaeota archaeon]